MALAYQVLVDPGQVEFGKQVMYDNGGWFLFVDGQCRYWTIPSDFPGEWGDVRTGRLSEPEAADLAAELLVADYPRLEGVHHGSIIHGSPISFHDGTHRVICTSACVGEAVPPELTRATDFGNEWVERLWARGQPIEGGGVRVVVVRIGESQRLLGPPARWPAEGIEVTEIAITNEEASFHGFGEGLLVEGADAEALRALRAEYRDGSRGNWFYRYLPIEDPTGESAGYRAYVRDALPFEDERGIVVAPLLPGQDQYAGSPLAP